MANSGITWGKPLVEFGLTGAEDAAPSSFKAMPTAEENTVLLTTRNVLGRMMKILLKGYLKRL